MREIGTTICRMHEKVFQNSEVHMGLEKKRNLAQLANYLILTGYEHVCYAWKS